jgi:hypothetical protein
VSALPNAGVRLSLLRALCPALGSAIASAGVWASAAQLGEFCSALQFCWMTMPSAACLCEANAALCGCLAPDARRGEAEQLARARGVATHVHALHSAFAAELDREGRPGCAANELCDCVAALFAVTQRLCAAMAAQRGDAMSVDALTAVTRNAVRCAASQNREASVCLLKCLTVLTSDAAFAARMRSVLATEGGHVAHALLEGMAGAAPPWVLTEIAKLLYSILKLVGADAFVQCVRSGFARSTALGGASFLRGSPKGREIFLELIVAKKASDNPTHFKRLCKNLCGGKKKIGQARKGGT